MIIRSGDDPFKNTKVLRGFNNTPDNIRDQMMINKKNMEKFVSKDDKKVIDNSFNKTFDPKRQREINIKMERNSK